MRYRWRAKAGVISMENDAPLPSTCCACADSRKIARRCARAPTSWKRWIQQTFGRLCDEQRLNKENLFEMKHWNEGLFSNHPIYMIFIIMDQVIRKRGRALFCLPETSKCVSAYIWWIDQINAISLFLNCLFKVAQGNSDGCDSGKDTFSFITTFLKGQFWSH